MDYDIFLDNYDKCLLIFNDLSGLADWPVE